MKHTLLYMLAAVLLLGVQSCKDDDPEPMVSITILKSDVLFKAAGGTGTVEFACEATPTAVSDKDWCHPSVSGKTVTVTVDPNIEYDARMATVTLSTGAVKQDVYVQQDGIVIIFPFKNRDYTVAAEGQTLEFTGTTTDEATFTTDADWLTVTPTEQGFTVNVAQNTLLSDRVGHVTVSAPTHDNKAVLTFTQDADLTAKTFGVAAAGGTYEFFGVTPKKATITTDADWLTISATATGFTVTADKNKIPKKRSGVVSVTVPGHDTPALLTFQQAGGNMPSAEGDYTMAFYTSSSESKLYEYDVKLVPGEEKGEYYITGLKALASGFADDAKMLIKQNTTTQQFVIANGTPLGKYTTGGKDYYGYVLVSYGNATDGAYFTYTIAPKYDIYFDYTLDDAGKYHLTLHNSYPELISSKYESYGMYLYYFSAPEPVKANKVGSIKTVRRPRFDQK